MNPGGNYDAKQARPRQKVGKTVGCLCASFVDLRLFIQQSGQLDGLSTWQLEEYKLAWYQNPMRMIGCTKKEGEQKNEK